MKMGTHRLTKEQFAIKIIKKSKMDTEELEQLKNEIQILKELNHPHIVKLYEVYDESSEIYLVTELCAGGEVFDRIVAKDGYNEKEARELMYNLLQTVEFIHDSGVVHRDLKPENLLLPSATNSTDIKLADFGFAKNVRDLNPKERPCGTFAYVPPEVILGKPFSYEVDIWSLGVIFYVLLVGYPPFPDDDLPTLFSRIKKGQYDFPQKHWGKVTPQAIDMIRKMMCVDQKARWTAKQLLRHPWMAIDGAILMQSNLSPTLEQLKKYRAHIRFRRVALAIVAAGKLARSGRSLAERRGSLDEDDEPTVLPIVQAIPGPARSTSTSTSPSASAALTQGHWFPSISGYGVVSRGVNSSIEHALCQSAPADDDHSIAAGPRGVVGASPLAPSDVVVGLQRGTSGTAKATQPQQQGPQQQNMERAAAHPSAANSSTPPTTAKKKTMFNCC